MLELSYIEKVHYWGRGVRARVASLCGLSHDPFTLYSPGDLPLCRKCAKSRAKTSGMVIDLRNWRVLFSSL